MVLTSPQPLYFLVASRTLSLAQIGGTLCAWSLPFVLFALIAFFVVTRTNMHRVMVWFGWFLVAIGVGLLTILTREAATAMWLCIAVFFGIGMGLLYPTLPSLAIPRYTALVKDGDSAVTNLVFFQTLGQTLGVAMGSAIFQNRLYRELLKRPALDELAMRYVKDAFELAEIIRDTKGDNEPLKIQVADAYIASIRGIWIVMAALAGIALVASFLLVKATAKARPNETEVRSVDEPYIV
jgi:MFS family permease